MAAILLFALCTAGLFYVLVGYPALLALVARCRTRPIRRAFEPRSVTVLLAVHNGARWIRAKLEFILSLDYPRDLVQVVVVSDASEDGTDEILREFAGMGVELVTVSRGGKAAALNAGMARAQGEILLFTDVRQTLAPDSLTRLVACFADPEVGVASGELVIRDGETLEESNVGLYWRYEKWIRKNLSRVDSVLGATGCLYAMRRELARRMPPYLLLDDVYLPLAAFFQGYRVVLEDGAHAFDTAVPLRSEFSRKVRTQAGVFQVMRFYPELLGWRNRMLVHFLSHKFGRLLLPYMLLGMGLASLGLPAEWRVAALAGQAVLYGASLLDLWLPESWGLKRLTSPLRTFVTLVASALFAVSIFFVPSSTLWKPAPAAAPPSPQRDDAGIESKSGI
jgi:cellulose synthase/poly-beta-1,6-N-acetylglucosamine synthase-like glycosyltransferase